MRAETGVNAKARGPPWCGRGVRPPGPMGHQRVGCIRELMWADLCPETDHRVAGSTASGRLGMSPGSARLHVRGTGALINTKSQER